MTTPSRERYTLVLENIDYDSAKRMVDDFYGAVVWSEGVSYPTGEVRALLTQPHSKSEYKRIAAQSQEGEAAEGEVAYANLAEMEHHDEEYECAMKCLDEAGVPRGEQHDEHFAHYSLWGRIQEYKATPPQSGIRGEGEVIEALRLVLPLAKGYAAEHPVGSNQEYVEFAEHTLSENSAPPGGREA